MKFQAFWFLLIIFLCKSLAEKYANQTTWPDSCTTTSLQSPINLEVTENTCDNSMVFNLKFMTTSSSSGAYFTFTRNDTHIMGKSTDEVLNLFATDVTGKFLGYQFSHVLFHYPSEHQIDGDSYDLEMQLYFTIQNDFINTSLSQQPMAAVAILFQETENECTLFSEELTSTTTTSTSLHWDLDSKLQPLIPTPTLHYSYKGSLTYPPCDEIVNWYVVHNPIDLTHDQLRTFSRHFIETDAKVNARDIQDLNDRVVKKGGITCNEEFVYFFSFFILYIFICYFVFKLL